MFKVRVNRIGKKLILEIEDKATAAELLEYLLESESDVDESGDVSGAGPIRSAGVKPQASTDELEKASLKVQRVDNKIEGMKNTTINCPRCNALISSGSLTHHQRGKRCQALVEARLKLATAAKAVGAAAVKKPIVVGAATAAQRPVVATNNKVSNSKPVYPVLSEYSTESEESSDESGDD